MKTVSPFEANLLRILHCFLQRAPVEQVLPLIRSTRGRPPCLSRAAVELVQDALRKGCLWILARSGGWRRERHLRGEQISEGRLWERTPPEQLGLTFSRQTLAFLLWITAGPPGDERSSWRPPPEEWTLGDRLLVYFAYQALRKTSVASFLRAQPPFASQELCRLAFPDDFAGCPAPVGTDFSPWSTSPGSCILEALQPELTERWLQVERGKGQIGDGQHMRALGQAQEHVLTAFCEAVDRAGRRDLARFLLHVAVRLLHENPSADAWIGRLALRGLRLADRTETCRAALVLLRQLERFQQWEKQARTVGYFDAGYAASQLWKADWEHCQGDSLCGQAQAILRAVEPLAG